MLDSRHTLLARRRRLYDLVKVKDEKYRVAFYWALNETLVAENMEQATRYPPFISLWVYPFPFHFPVPPLSLIGFISTSNWVEMSLTLTSLLILLSP